MSLGWSPATAEYSAFHPSGVGKWVPAAAGKAKAGMAHSDCGWTCGCADKTVKSLENTCHTWALLRWWFTTKRRFIKCMHLYLYPPEIVMELPGCGAAASSWVEADFLGLFWPTLNRFITSLGWYQMILSVVNVTDSEGRALRSFLHPLELTSFQYVGT